jgi:heme/copper-type cytochrome/quinol oxidase subunit 3
MERPPNQAVLDVSDLPTVAFGPRNVTWLGNVFYMAIEGAMFAFLIATYFYLRARSIHWPPEHQNPPALRYGIANAIMFLCSLAPARWIQLRARTFDRGNVRAGLGTLALFGLAAIILRAFEFSALHCRWSDNAYASAIWVLIGLHTGHLITEWIETLAIFGISLTSKMEGSRMVDAAINSDYWYFVVATAMAADFVIYITARFVS